MKYKPGDRLVLSSGNDVIVRSILEDNYVFIYSNSKTPDLKERPRNYFTKYFKVVDSDPYVKQIM